MADFGVRVDSGFASGDEVSTFYDAMLAKVIAWAPTRDQAIRMLVAALRSARIHGVTTNRDQLVEILTDPVFVAGEMTTTWLESRPISAESPGDSPSVDRTAVVAGALMLAADDAERRTVQQGVPAAWRNVVSQPQRTTFEGHDPVEWWGTRDGFAADGVTVLEVSPTHARLEVDGVVTETRGHISSERPGAPRDGVGRQPGLVRASTRGPALHRSRRRGGERLAARADARHGRGGQGGGRGRGGRGRRRPRAGGHEDAAHRDGAHNGTVAEINVEPGSQVASGEVLAVVATKEVEEQA